MRAPAEFVVLRHLLTHPEDTPHRLARHSGLPANSASVVLQRLRRQGVWTPEQILARLTRSRRRPDQRTLGFRIPNPRQWFQAYRGAYWASGEAAAAHDGFDLVPQRYLVYIHPSRLDHALRAVHDTLGDLAPKAEANLLLRVADPWLTEGEEETLVEYGQRVLDYLESDHVQLAASLARRRTP